MKYSVLMSVYKKESPEFLKTALESIYEGQTRKPDEIVVVFDGELTDELYSVLEKFREDKQEIVKYYPQQQNRGLGVALKIGSEQCTGDYIFRMDTDDISLPERFEKQIEYIEAHPEVDVLGAAISEFEKSPENEQMRRRVCPCSHEEIVKRSKRRNPMNHMTVCIKKSALEVCGGYEPLLLLEDYYLWLRMLAYGCRFANLAETLVYARVGNGFNTRRGSKKQLTGWKHLQKFMLNNGMISRSEAAMNMAYMRGFVYCPDWVRGIAYEKVLRK